MVNQSLRDVARLIAVLSWKKMKKIERRQVNKIFEEKLLTQLEGEATLRIWT